MQLNYKFSLLEKVFMKKKIGKVSLFLAILAVIWLLLGMVNIVPFLIELPQETSIRAHASLAVILLLIASWAFWNED
jgi:hypothetical protein